MHSAHNAERTRGKKCRMGTKGIYESDSSGCSGDAKSRDDLERYMTPPTMTHEELYRRAKEWHRGSTVRTNTSSHAVRRRGLSCITQTSRTSEVERGCMS